MIPLMKIHIDIDSFFVSAERIKDPSLEGIPIAVGGRSDGNIFNRYTPSQSVNLENRGAFVSSFYERYDASKARNNIEQFKDSHGVIRGILTTASYEARAFGISTAMSINEAIKRCPNLIIKTPDMAYYQKLSHQLHNFLNKKIPKIEQASIDEFYGDLDGWIEDENVHEYIQKLKSDIKTALHLPVSIGAAHTKSIAKLATTSAKPFGTRTIFTHEHYDFVKDITIEAFPGIGKRMRTKLKNYALHTLADVLAAKELVTSISPYAKELYHKIEGSDNSDVNTSRVRKSIGMARTFDAELDRKELKRRVIVMSRHLSFAIMKLHVLPTTYHFSLSYSGNQHSSANISSNTLFHEQHLQGIMLSLYQQSDIHSNTKVIRISMNASHFTHTAKRELSLIDFDDAQKAHHFSKTLFELRSRYGLNIIKYGSEF